jgi:hypothetical protein
MKILYVACGGFGDVSWTTSWPRLWTEKGHEIDVFLLKFTGNPFHANPFIRNIFIKNYMEAYKEIRAIIEGHSYDIILIPNSTVGGMCDVIEVTKNMKNVLLFRGTPQSQLISDLEIPPLTKPEWYYTKNESEYIEKLNLKNSILFHPLSSDVNEKSRNIDFDLIIECSKKLNPIIVVYGGRKYLPMDNLEKIKAAGINLLWEDYNCFNDESGSALGKFLALTSHCQASVHAWSGSFTLSMGYNKPYVMVAPGYGIRANSASPYIDTKILYEEGIQRAAYYGCLNPSAWCITNKSEIIIEAVNHILLKKTCTFDKKWLLN